MKTKANPESNVQPDLAKCGVAAWNEWRVANIGVRPNLSEADLSEADLSEADLSEADLREADLSEADLRGAIFRGTCIDGADIGDGLSGPGHILYCLTDRQWEIIKSDLAK